MKPLDNAESTAPHVYGSAFCRKSWLQGLPNLQQPKPKPIKS